FDDRSGAAPALYAAGGFSMAGGAPASHIARWNGIAWSPLGIGLDGFAPTMASFDDGVGGGPSVYVGGQFTASPAGDSFIARWSPCVIDIPSDLNGDGTV